MRIHTNKYFKKLVLFSLILGVLPVIVVGILSYYKSSMIIQDKVDVANMQLLQQSQMGVEQLLKIADRSLIYFADSVEVRTMIHSNLSPYDFEKINDVSHALVNLQSYDMGIKDAYMVNYAGNWIINNDSVMKLEEFSKKAQLYKLQKCPKPSFWAVDENSLSRMSQNKSEGVQGDLNIMLYKKLPINSLDAQAAVTIIMSGTHLSELLSSGRELGDIMILDENYHVLADKDERYMGMDVSQEGYIQNMKQSNKASGFYETVRDGKKISVSYLHSEYNNWIYVSTASIDQVTKDSKSIGWITFFVCLAMFAPVCVISLLGSLRMYHPIHNIYNSLANTSDIDVSKAENDDIKFIEDRVSLLKRDRSKMLNQIHRQLQQLKEFYVLKLLQGEINEEELEDKLKLYNYSDAIQWMCVMVLQIDTFDGTSYSMKDRDLVLFAINNIVGELIGRNIILCPIVTGSYQVTTLGGEQENFEEYKNFLYNTAEIIQKTVDEHLGLSVSIGISKLFKTLNHTHKAFEEGMEALKYQIRIGYTCILFIEDVQAEPTAYGIFPLETENALLNAVKSADSDKALKLLHSYMAEVFEVKLNFNEYQIPLTRLLANLIQIVQESGESYRVICNTEKSVFRMLFQLKTVDEIENWFANSIVQPVIRILDEKNTKHYKKIAQDLIDIIDAEYDSNITLESCAGRMNYHSSYLRRVFRKETGINFSDYLAQFRLKKAKDWLVNTEMKISDIAERLQYNNSQNFIRSFRKLEGITPGQYRENSR